MSYRTLEVWEIARDIAIRIHEMSLKLPSFEMWEEGRQIRRSIKSVKSNIVEGYGRKRYKMDYIRFLTFALASNDETIDHLENLFETGSLKDKTLYLSLKSRLKELGIKLRKFIEAVESKHRSGR